MHHVTVFKEPGKFAGWPANNGVWSWGNEILVAFSIGKFELNVDGRHSVAKDVPQLKGLARSKDGGETWSFEPAPILQRKKAAASPGGVNFSHPDFALHVNGKLFYFSYDRGKAWHGPYELPLAGYELTSRTDYLVNGAQDAFLFLSAKQEYVKVGGYQDRAFCARTRDGLKTLEFVAWMSHEPFTTRSVMPSTVRVGNNELVTAIRRRDNSGEKQRMWVDAFGSADNGRSWKLLSKVGETEKPARPPLSGEPKVKFARNGNPPALVRLKDGRIVVAYGYRSGPYGIRARISQDNGKTWGAEIVLRDDGKSWDLGYPRMVQRADGKLVTIYYFHTSQDPEQHIAATIWDPSNHP